MKANVFIVGACKSGTTNLHHFLGEQKDVCASSPKEPYFFELPIRQRDPEKYIEKYFKHYNNELFLLDGRHRNMFFNWAPAAIKSYNSAAKVIVILRDPIERAYSHWWMWYSRRVVKDGFYKHIKKELKHIKTEGLLMDMSPEKYMLYVQESAYEKRMTYADAETIVESGFYNEQLKQISKVFDEKNILIIDYKRIADKAFLSKELSTFLAIPIFNLVTNEVKNEAKSYVKTTNPISKFIPKKIKNIIKDLLYKKPRINKKTKKLLQSIYREKDYELMENYNLEFVKHWISQK
ncbi:sulfotransferase domain-containing protein [Lacinutrix undariae]